MAERSGKIRVWRAEERISGSRALEECWTYAAEVFTQKTPQNPCNKQEELTRLRLALRAERALGRAGHPTYDLGRHLALMRSLALENQRQKIAAL